MKLQCPKCKKEVEYLAGECEICPECGSELMPDKQTEGQQNDLWKGVDFASVLSQVTDSSAGQTPAGDLSARSKAIADEIENLDFDKPRQSDCPYLQVEYNRDLFFVSGSNANMKLQVTPLVPELEELHIFMELRQEQSEKLSQVPVNSRLTPHRPIEVTIPFRPEKISGRVAINFYFGCKVKNERRYYQFQAEHTIYDPNQTCRSLSSQIIINQQITAQQAADVNYRDSIGDALRQMQEKSLTVNEMLDKQNNLPPRYVVIHLTETTWTPDSEIISGSAYPADKLMLEWNNLKILLIGKNHIKLGRSAEQCDLLVRTTGCGRLSPQDYPNTTVSRLHAEILYNGDFIQLFDRSSYGTYINERKPDSAGMRIPDSATVEFGDIHWKMEIQHCESKHSHAICQSCQAKKIKSLTFTRKDREPEHYLLVWQCCELGRIIPELLDWTVFFRDNKFFIRTPEQNFHYLRPGNTFRVNDQTVKVNYFRQN